MTIQILKTVPLHESLILRLSRSTPTGGYSLLHEFINPGAALARKADQNLRALGRVTDRFVRECLEEAFDEKHGIQVLAKNQTRR